MQALISLSALRRLAVDDVQAAYLNYGNTQEYAGKPVYGFMLSLDGSRVVFGWHYQEQAIAWIRSNAPSTFIYAAVFNIADFKRSVLNQPRLVADLLGTPSL